MTSWYALTIIALVLMGTQRFLYKVSAERNCNTALTTFAFMGTVSIISGVLFLLMEESVSDLRFLLFIASLNSISFAAGTIAHMEALKRVPASVAYPIIRLNVAVVVVFSILFFDDRLSGYQLVGIGLALAVILMLTRQTDGGGAQSPDVKRGMALVFVSMLSGSVASISSKFAAMYANRLGFMAVSYFMGPILALGLKSRLDTAGGQKKNREALAIGVIMGLINFVGFHTFLQALAAGPLSIIISMVGIHFVIAILLSAVVYKEKLTHQRLAGIGLAIISVVLLKM